MSDQNTRRPIHEIAMELRDAMDDLLPEGVGVTMNTSEQANGTGSINLTVACWPDDMFMLNYDRVVAERRAVLEGRSGGESRFPYLSAEAKHLAEVLQSLIDSHFPPVVDEAGNTDWPVTGGVTFDPHVLERERLKIIYSLKASPRKG
jgi:hypothetical protein